MTKYKIGQRLLDKEDGGIYTIIGIAPTLDSEFEQTYFTEVDDRDITGVDYWVFSDKYFEQYAKLID